MDQIRQTMKLTKTTKGTYVFSDESEDAVVPTLYVKKSHFKGAAPKSLVLIVRDRVPK